MWPFSEFQYGFRSLQSTAVFLAAVSDKIVGAFNKSWATPAVANLSLTEFQVRYLVLLFFSVIDGLEWFRMGNLDKNIQLMLEFFKGSFLVLHFSYLH